MGRISPDGPLGEISVDWSDCELYMTQIFPDDWVGETQVDWFDSVGFSTLISLFLVYRAILNFSLGGSAGVFAFGYASQHYLIFFRKVEESSFLF